MLKGFGSIWLNLRLSILVKDACALVPDWSGVVTDISATSLSTVLECVGESVSDGDVSRMDRWQS